MPLTMGLFKDFRFSHYLSTNSEHCPTLYAGIYHLEWKVFSRARNFCEFRNWITCTKFLRTLQLDKSDILTWPKQ